METVLVLPILTILIFAIVQFALIWYAQIMTQYAAYNAARAALVYHPGEYRVVDEMKRVTDRFKTDSGPCWEAACRTLAWVSSSPGGGTSKFGVPGWYDVIPSSSHISNQVHIVQSTNTSRNQSVESLEMTNAPVVRVTVEFDFPLHVPVVGHMLAYFYNVEDKHPSKYEVWGWKPDAAGETKLNGSRRNTMNVDYITLSATALMPKPYRTSHYARIPSEDDSSPTALPGIAVGPVLRPIAPGLLRPDVPEKVAYMQGGGS